MVPTLHATMPQHQSIVSLLMMIRANVVRAGQNWRQFQQSIQIITESWLDICTDEFKAAWVFR